MLKRMQAGNKVKMLLLAIAFLSVLIRCIYIISDDRIKGSYYTEERDVPVESEVVSGEIIQEFICENDHLYAVEFAFPESDMDSEMIMCVEIEKEGERLFQTRYDLEGVEKNKWHRINVNIPVTAGDIYALSIADSSEDADTYRLYLYPDEGIEEEGNCYVDGQLQEHPLALKLGYLKHTSTADKILQIITVLLLYILFGACVLCFEQLRSRLKKSILCLEYIETKNKYIFVVGEVVLCWLILQYAGIEFSKAVSACMLLLSIVSSVFFLKELPNIKSMLEGKWIYFILLDLYAAFALVGNRSFVFPIGQRVSYQGYQNYILAALWFIPVLGSAFIFLDRLNIKTNENRFKNKFKLGIVLGVLLVVPAAVALYAFNPGISSPDTHYCMALYAHSIKGMPNWHPPFYVMLLKAIMKIWDSTYAVIGVQFIFWIYVMLEMLFFLRSKGCKDNWLITTAALSGMNAGNFLYLCTIWKDIPYTLSLLWLTVVIAKIVLDVPQYSRKWYVWFELTVSLVFTCLIRQNGIVPYILVFIMLLAIMRKQKKCMVSLVVSLLLILFVQGPVYRYAEVTDGYVGGKYIGLSQDILGVYFNGGEIPEDILPMIDVLTEGQMAAYGYTPYWSSCSYDLDMSMPRFIFNYCRVFLKNPVLMMRTIICRQDALWDIFDGKKNVLNCVNYTATMDDNDIWLSYYPARQENVYTQYMSTATEYSVSTQLVKIIEWRAGIWLLLLMISVVFLLSKHTDRRVYIIYVPILGHIAGLFLSTGWSDFRYYWPVNLISLFVVLLVPLICKNNTDSGQKE